jgi:CheY-like chemotaxis protein
MAVQYRILLVEDIPSDAYLVEREVKKILGNVIFECVETSEEYTKSMVEFKPDLVLSDFCIPGFDWLTAFQISRKLSPVTPFIVVSGSTNPIIANECLKMGVTDFISKNKIGNLGPSIINALEIK